MKKTLAILASIGMVCAVQAADDDWHKGALSAEGKSIDPTTLPEFNAPKVWHYKAPATGTPTVGKPTRIVAYADKWTRHGMGGFGATCMWRKAQSPVSPFKESDVFITRQDFDVDGDGKTDDDYVDSIPFTLSEPFNIPHWPGSATFPEPTSGKFCGAMSWYFGNTQLGKGRHGEMGINYDHSPPFFDGRAENHPLNGLPDAKTPGACLRYYTLFFWRKDQFASTRPEDKVTFDETSRVASLVTRNYCEGFNDARMVAMDGDTLYISDNETFPPIKAGYKFGTKENPVQGIVFQACPAKLKWAKYEPKEHLIHFDAKNAKFEHREFKDVQGVGWYFGKDSTDGPSQAHFKWYGIEFVATVHGVQRGSPNFDMKWVEGDKAVPGFWMTSTEIPYSFFKKIHKYGSAPFHQVEPRYVYRNDGDMGSMRKHGDKELHYPEEPVTNLAFYDALAWCNTWSEYEGRTPCYYSDPEFKTVFRNEFLWTRSKINKGRDGKTNPVIEKSIPPKVYVKWEADGFRLPTPSEWKQAHGAVGEQEGWTKKDSGGRTQPVGQKKPNAKGFYDMNGNVWELVWTQGASYDPESECVTVLGGDFNFPDDPRKGGASPWGDGPYRGAYNIGLRVVSRKPGTAKPSISDTYLKPAFSAGETPSWTFSLPEKTKPENPPAQAEKNIVEMVKIPGGSFKRHEDKVNIKVHPYYMGKTAVTFDQWNRVRQWAEANKYSFSLTGNMGSMYNYLFPHRSDEPVVRMHWYDALVFCNALSEMEGRKPFYYSDPECTKPYRNALPYRPIQFDCTEYMPATKDKPHWAMDYMGGLGIFKPEPWIFEKWDVDGYRLPTAAEYEFAVAGGAQTKYYWGNDASKINDHCWWIGNSGGRTHPVATKQPNQFGLYDIYGNVVQWNNSTEAKLIAAYRPPSLDTNNPKGTRNAGYGKRKLDESPNLQPLYAGISWIWHDPDLVNKEAFFPAVQNFCNYHEDLGFRVVRCDAGTHPADGKEPLKEDTLVKFKVEDYRSLAPTE